jgi:arginine repressor
MKGKNPTRKQKNIIKENKLNPDNWLVLKILKNRICIQPKVSKKIREI